ncbi:protein phosphatase 2A regulatory B subunit (B56 family) domain-containing protein [Ditylenchus destructor]|uniref:Protein phosphatase 2A regulatory B subunit (B56 family) domain-containing protein n=1 Tax=Ditylenchus destructor TaxID=166010 RepID=A0AAD4R8I4_9BILA|nr:protein phosphatase 2A regulatory B subunit (B56 family) domain-containing protein [Ditylenchus destructor]
MHKIVLSDSDSDVSGELDDAARSNKTPAVDTGSDQVEQAVITQADVDEIDLFRKRSIEDSPPQTSKRRQLSTYRSRRSSNLEELPLIMDAQSEGQKVSLALQKLKQCQNVYDFSDSDTQLASKEIKRNALNELIDFVSLAVMPLNDRFHFEIFLTFSRNIFRTLKPKLKSDVDVEEEEPALEVAWPHLQLVYQLFVGFFESFAFELGLAKKHIDQTFLLNLLNVFNSEDPRERAYLKAILHKIYGRFMVFRAYIRKQINFVFLSYVFESQPFNGIPEFLDILASVISGFALPLKDEHRTFFRHVLLPLHKPARINFYHASLITCMVQFIDKMPELTSEVFDALIKYWPIASTSKEVKFLTEIEEILTGIDAEQFKNVIDPLFKQLAKSILSPHFQVVERALMMWTHEYIWSLIQENNTRVIPIVFRAIYKLNKEQHWHKNINTLVTHAMKSMLEMNTDLFEELALQHEQ